MISISGLFKEFIILSSIIFIHEIGHLFFAYVFKWHILKIDIYPFGGCISFSQSLNKPILEEFIILIGGYITQIIYFLTMYVLYNNNLITIYNFNIFKKYCIIIFIFNLLPIHPLDGSKLISLLLYKIFSFNVVNKLKIIISFVAIFILLSNYTYFLNYNISIIFIYLIIKNIKEIKYIKYIFKKFLLERYLYNIKFYKTKVIKNNNIKKMKRDKKHIFYINNKYITEKDVLNGIFKNYDIA
ncbi:MAG: M50 family metallopeptidase [Bacilli bacterium]